MLFSAMIGAGYQVTVVTFAVIIFAILGELYTE
jgi:transmembrane 9 superfamily protein 3